ncbi:MAG: 4Fe-4S binding protein [Bacteroidetes bacterium]|nr:4Fe-4S binding protein [Bacteroidota bacterium]
MNWLIKHNLAVWTFSLTAFVLSIVQWKLENPMILIERFIPYSGWVMILILAFYAAFLVSKMKEPSLSAKWRRRSWTLFSTVFFVQLILGVAGFEKFLMTPDKLHFPIPALIVGGPVYRGHISFMPILFLITIILSGPAWCSQLCYFGAIDNLVAARGNPKSSRIFLKNTLKHTFLFLVIVTAIIFRVAGIETTIVSTFAAIFGIAGLIIILVVSSGIKKMYHCTVYCPIGTVIRYAKYINPFRMYIDSNCTECMACTKTCYYDALNKKDIQNRKPASTCTLCGDCVTSCHTSSIKYRFLKLKPEQARNLYLIITITIHAVFLGLARL